MEHHIKKVVPHDDTAGEVHIRIYGLEEYPMPCGGINVKDKQTAAGTDPFDRSLQTRDYWFFLSSPSYCGALSESGSPRGPLGPLPPALSSPRLPPAAGCFVTPIPCGLTTGGPMFFCISFISL